MPLFDNGPPRRRSTSSSSREGYRRRRWRSSRGREAARRAPLREVRAVQVAQGGLQRARSSSCRRPRAASTGRALEDPARTPLGVQYNIFDSERYVLTFDNRALRDAASAAPYDVRRDPRQRGAVRRRRHLQRPGDGVGRHGVRRVRVRPRVRPPLRRRSPTSTTRRTSPTRRARRNAPSRGSRTSPRSKDPASAEVERPRRRRDAAADAVGQGGVREARSARVSRPSAGS